MAYTYEEFKKRRAAEKQSISAADAGSAAKTQRSGYTYDEFMARRQERLRAEEEKKAMQPLEDAYRAAGEKATADAEAAEKRYGEASVGMSPALQLRRAILGNPKIDTSEDPQKEYEEALKEYAAAKEEADFYRQHQTYADLQKYVEEEEKKAQKKAARFTEYTDEAGKAALSRYKSDDDEYIVVNGEVLTDAGLSVTPTIDGKPVTLKEYGEHLKEVPSYDWTDDERRRFAYLNERDPEDAAEYAREINKAHAAEAQEKERAKREEFATSSFLAEIATTAENVLLGGPEGLMDYFATLLDPEFKEYLKGLTPYDASSAGAAAITEKLNREGVISESVPIFGGKGLGDAYQLAVSILQSTVYGIIGNLTGTQIFTFIGFFGQAAAGGINEAKAKGATDEQAIIYGTVAGFFEGLFEEVSLDKIWKMSSPTTLKALIKNLLKSSTIEAEEEFVTSMADALAEKFILAEKSDWEKEGFLKVLEGAIYDAAAGFVSGAVQGGAHTIVTAASTVQAGKNVTAEERASLKENLAKLSETAEGKKKIDIPTDSKSKLINDYTSGAMLEAFNDLYGYEGKKNIFGKIKTPYENRIKDALTSFGKTSQMSEDAIKDLTDGFDGTVDADVYAKGFYDYYNAGKSGVSFDKVSTAASGELRGAAAAIAYNDGRIAGIEAGTQKTATTAENVDVVKGEGETAKAGQNVESEASSGRTAISWAFGENGRRVYSGAGAAAPTIYDDAMFRVYADAYAGKSDAAIFKTARELYGDAVSEDAISDMIEAAIDDRAGKKTAKIVRREGKVNFEGVKLSSEEKRALSALAQFAGVDIDFADLGDANGRYADGKITIDTNAENPLAVVLGHEAFHRFRELAPSEAEVIERLAYEAATEKDPDAVRKVVEKYTSRTGAAFRISDAVEEIAADYMGDIVESPEKLSALIKLANTKKKKSALARFVAWVRERWENFKSRRGGELSGAEKKTDDAVDAIVDMMRRAKIELAGVPVTGTNDENMHVSEEKYSQKEKYDFSKSFAEQIDDYKNGFFPKWDTLIVRDTPKRFRDIDLNALPMTYTSEHLDEALTNEDGNHLGEKLLKKVPDALEEPIAIIDSSSRPGRLVAIIEIPNGSNKTIAAVEIDGSGKMHGLDIDSNAIVSIYEKENIYYKHLIDAIKSELSGNGGIYYWQKNKAMRNLITSGVQFPGITSLPDGFIRSIDDPLSKVNRKIENVTKTKQFKRWFGNSKVVNEDGTPKVVYHQTAADFTIFSTENPVAGKNDSETPNGIFLKDNDHDIGIGGNRQMALYARMEKPLHFANREEARAWYVKNIPEYASVQKEFDKRTADFNKKSAELDDQWFEANRNDDETRLEEIEKQEDELIKSFEPIEVEYSQKLRAILNDYFINGNSGYDGIILDYDGHRYVNGKRENVHTYIVFKNTQIKSATDNIGTFDGSNPDIRYSLKKTSAEAKIAELEKEVNALRKEIDRIENGGVLTGGTVPSPTKMKKLVDGLFEGYAGEKTKRALSDELSEVYAKMVKYAKMQNGAAKDEAWAKISEKLGDISADICRGSLGSEISDATERLNLYSADMSYAVEAQKVEIMCELFEMPNYITAADKIAALKADKADALKKVREQRRAIVKAEKLAGVALEDVDTRYYESEVKRKLLNKVKRLSSIKYVNREYTIDGKTVNVQTLINNAVNDAVESMKSIKDLDVVSVGMRSSTREWLENLSELYSAKMDKHSPLYDPDFCGDERTERDLARLSKVQIKDLSLADAVRLLEALSNVETVIRTQNKMIDSKLKHDNQQNGIKTMAGINGLSGINRGLYNKAVWYELSPMRAIARIVGYDDTNPLYVLTKELNDGQRKMLDWIVKHMARFDEFTNDAAYIKKLAGKHADIIMTVPGKNGECIMTRGMLMSLYLHSANSQNMAHVSAGGVVMPDAKLYKNGDVIEAYKQGAKMQMTRSEIVKLANEHLTERDFQFIAAARTYFNVKAKEGINEVSNKLLGYDLAKVGEYFPITVDEAFLKADYGSLNQFGGVESQGNLQERQDDTKPIYLYDMTTVLNRMIELNARYIGLAIPIRNMNKLLNVATVKSALDSNGSTMLLKEITSDGNEHFIYNGSVKDTINHTWGSGATEYINRMMEDVQGKNHGDEDIFGTFADKVRSLYAQATLTVNANVALKQAASYPTAAAVIGWKALIKGLNPTRHVNLDVVARYTPLLAYRSLGYASIDLGDIAKHGRHLPKRVNWIQGVDVLTTMRLWVACEYYIEDTNPNLKRWSEEYYRAVAEVYNRVIEETQPNYTAMQRPQLLRSRNALVKQLTMFKTQPMQNFNLIFDAFGAVRARSAMCIQNPTDANKAALKEAKQRLRRVISSQIVQAAMMAAITLGWSKLVGKLGRYKDDDDELGGWTAMRVLIDIVENLGSGVIGATEITAIFEAMANGAFTGKSQYYGIEAVTPAAITDFVDAFVKISADMNKLFNDKLTQDQAKRDIKNLTQQVGRVTGVPVANVDNIFKIIFRIFGIAGEDSMFDGWEK